MALSARHCRRYRRPGHRARHPGQAGAGGLHHIADGRSCASLKPILDAKRGRADEHILLNSDGKPWTEDGFRSSWAKACDKAGIEGVTFHDLRGTFVTWAARAGAEAPEIADITGHGVDILDKHYLCRDGSLGDNVIAKLEAGSGTEIPKRTPKRPKLVYEKG